MPSAGIAQRSKNPGRDTRDDGQHVYPKSPVSCVPVGHGFTQTKAAEEEWEASGSCLHEKAAVHLQRLQRPGHFWGFHQIWYVSGIPGALVGLRYVS